MFRFLLLIPLTLGCGANFPEATVGTRDEAQAPAAGEKAPAKEAAPSRKIIYTASLDIVVKDFQEGRKALMACLEAHQGYVAKSEIGSSTGYKRGGTWTLRIPVERFQIFLEEAQTLGEVIRNLTDAQDVTDEFFDIEARLKNKRVEEERLIEHLKKSTGKLEDILACERELTRVRGEIEQAQGRLQKLDKLSTMTTVTITLTERKDYVPPTAPTMSTRISRVFGDSLENLRAFGEELFLVLVALTPWSPILAGAGYGIYRLTRRVWRRSDKHAITPPTTPA